MCPECGAPEVEGFTCWEQLGAILAWEWQDPELAAIHFLTVVSYNLQHPAQFTEPALAGLREQFIAHLDQGVPVSEIRRRVGKAAAGAARVLVSLWDVNDKSTASLMSEFYRNLLPINVRAHKPFSPAQSLREAQLFMLKQPQWRAPYYWAAFVQHGEPR